MSLKENDVTGGYGPLAAPSTQTSIRRWAPLGRAWGLFAPRADAPTAAALVDQAVASLGTFVTALLVAQHLAPRDNGAFALLMDAVLLLNGVQAAMILHPFGVRATVLGRTDTRLHCGAALCLTALVLVPFGAGLIAYGLIMHLAEPAFWAAAALCAWQVQETLRRTLLARRKFLRALPGDAISYLGQAGAVALCVYYTNAHVGSVFAILTATSSMAAAVQVLQTRPLRISRESLRFVAGQYWSESKWMVAGALTAIPTMIGYSFTLYHFHGLATVGQYQAIAILIRIVNPVLAVLGPLVVAASVRGSFAGGMRGARRAARRFFLVATVLLLPIYGLLWVGGRRVIEAVYGKAQPAYAELGPELRWFAVASCAGSAAILMTALLDGARRSRRAVAARLVLAIFASAVALPLAAGRGLYGLLVGSAIANGAWAAALLVMILFIEMKESRVDRTVSAIDAGDS